MKYWIGERVRLSEACRGRLMQTATEKEHVRVATENRSGVVIQWIAEAAQPKGYLVDFQGIYMALKEEDLEVAE